MELDGDTDKIQRLSLGLVYSSPFICHPLFLCPKHSEKGSIIHAKLMVKESFLKDSCDIVVQLILLGFKTLPTVQ